MKPADSSSVAVGSMLMCKLFCLADFVVGSYYTGQGMARVRAIQEAMCGFLLDEVINPKGEFYCDLRTSVAKEDPKTRKLIRYYS